jgi:uncharacterized membrane protein YobD (UPF0266 family)
MSAKALDLFQAYSQGKLPMEGGYLVSSFFDRTSTYSIYEIVAYSGVKSINLTEDGLTFQTDGNKLYILVEPASYAQKYIEPVNRDSGKSIPHRFKELVTYTAKNQSKVHVSKEPLMSYTSFTILKPTGINFALVFYNLPEVFESIDFFFNQTLNKEADIPKLDAKKASKLIIERLKTFNIW